MRDCEGVGAAVYQLRKRGRIRVGWRRIVFADKSEAPDATAEDIDMGNVAIVAQGALEVESVGGQGRIRGCRSRSWIVASELNRGDILLFGRLAKALTGTCRPRRVSS